MRARKSFIGALLITLTMLGFSYTPAGAQGLQRAFNWGFRMAGSGDVRFALTGTDQFRLTSNNFFFRDVENIGWTASSDPAGTPDAWFSHGSGGANGHIVLNSAGTPMLQFGGTTSSFPALKQTSSALLVRLADDSAYADLIAGTVSVSTAQVTQASGTGITPTIGGAIERVTYKTTITSPAFTCAALTCDITIATLPAGTILKSVYAQITAAFACASTCTTATLSFTIGSSAGAADIFASTDADAGTNIFGHIDTHLGTAMVRAAQVQGGKLFNIASTTPVSMRFTSGTGNIGTGAASNLSQGTVIIWLMTEKLP